MLVGVTSGHILRRHPAHGTCEHQARLAQAESGLSPSAANGRSMPDTLRSLSAAAGCCPSDDQHVMHVAAGRRVINHESFSAGNAGGEKKSAINSRQMSFQQAMPIGRAGEILILFCHFFLRNRRIQITRFWPRLHPANGPGDRARGIPPSHWMP